jgi:hypothetical protein
MPMNGSTILPLATGGSAAVPSAGAVVSTGSALASVAAGTVGNVLTDNGTTWVSQPAGGAGGGQFIIDPTSTTPVIQTFDEFLPYNFEAGSNNPVGPLSLVFEGTAVASTPVPSSEKNRIGIVQLTSTSSSQYSGYVSALQPIVFGGAAHSMSGSFYVPSLPTSTNSYGIQFGFGDSFPSITNAAIIYFNYLNANWQAETYSNGTGTNYVDTGIPVAIGWNNVRVDVNAAGTSVGYYVNGVLGTTITTNIPTLYPLGLFCLVICYSGATVNVKSDWVEYNYQLATARGTR